jgi:phosphatidate cytidylyltransferase
MAAPKHGKRLVTGLALIALVVLGLWIRSWLEIAIIALISSAALLEFYNLFRPKLNAFMAAAGVAAGLGIIAAGNSGDQSVMVIILLAAFWLGNLRFLIRYSRMPSPNEPKSDYRNELIFTSGLVYIPLLMQFLLTFRRVEIVLVLLTVIATDAGAYYAGSTFGGPKLWPVISPKKTWTGSLGGLTASILLCLGMGYVDEYWLAGSGQGRPWWMWILLGAGLSVAAQFGDFFVSALKRKQEVKDTGHLLPGHGGVLDRVDSLLLALPAYAGLDAAFNFFA